MIHEIWSSQALLAKEPGSDVLGKASNDELLDIKTELKT